MDYSKLTLGELLSSENETIRRNAISVLKVLQKKTAITDTEAEIYIKTDKLDVLIELLRNQGWEKWEIASYIASIQKDIEKRKLTIA